MHQNVYHLRSGTMPPPNPPMATFRTLILKPNPGFFISFELRESASCLWAFISSSSRVIFIWVAITSLFMLGGRHPYPWFALFVCFPRFSLKFFEQQSRLSACRSLEGVFSQRCSWAKVAVLSGCWILSESAIMSELIGSLGSSLSRLGFSDFSERGGRKRGCFWSCKVWFLRLSLCTVALLLGFITLRLCHSPQSCSSISSTMRFCLFLMPACSLRKRSSLAWRSAIYLRSQFMSTVLVNGFLFQMSRIDTTMLRPRLWKVYGVQSCHSRLQYWSSLSSSLSLTRPKISQLLLYLSRISQRQVCSLPSYSKSFSPLSQIFSAFSLRRYLMRQRALAFFSGRRGLSQELRWQPHSRVYECTMPSSLQKTTLAQPSLLMSSFLSLAFMCFREKMHCQNSKLMQFWESTLGQSWLSTCSMNSQIALPKMKFPLWAGCACKSRYMNSRFSFEQSSHSFLTAKQEGCFSGSGLLQQRFRFWFKASIRQCPRATPSGFSMGTRTKTKYLRSRKARMSFLSRRNLRTPFMQQLEGVSMGCTRAEMNIMGLLLRKRTSFWSLNGSPFVHQKPSFPSWELIISMSIDRPSQLLVSQQRPKNSSLSQQYCVSSYQASLRHCSQLQGQMKANSTWRITLLNMKSNFSTNYYSQLRQSPKTGQGNLSQSEISPFSYFILQTGRYCSLCLICLKSVVPWHRGSAADGSRR